MPHDHASNDKGRVATISLAASAVLALVKFAAALVSGSLGLLSEAFHSLLDCGATALTLFAVRFGDQPADDDHHYGHAKAESLAALVETGLLFLVTLWVCYEAVLRLISNDHSVEISWWLFAVVFGSIIIELFEKDTPGTVDNFLNYVNDGDYINSFFHRLDDDFVLQGGGFKTTSPTFTNTSQFSEVPTDATIKNEPGISNLRGTVAMAKLGGQPDSATSQFFVNLSDDNTFLDSAANNAFTVFGKILGMSTVDTIAALPINTDHASPFDELLLSATNQLATIESIAGQGTIAGVEYRDANSSGSLDAGDLSGLVLGVSKGLSSLDTRGR